MHVHHVLIVGVVVVVECLSLVASSLGHQRLPFITTLTTRARFVRPLSSALAALTCLGFIISGVYLMGGVPWALVATGCFGLGIVVLLYDPKRPPKAKAQKSTVAEKPRLVR